jgi:hypothetical protein
MDIIQTRRKKKKKSESTSEKSVQDKALEDISLGADTFTVDGKIYKMPPDLNNLPEFDWDDPENQKMIQKEEAVRIKKYGKLTCKQMDQICKVKEALLKEKPALPRKKAFDLSWEKVTGKKLRS